MVRLPTMRALGARPVIRWLRELYLLWRCFMYGHYDQVCKRCRARLEVDRTELAARIRRGEFHNVVSLRDGDEQAADRGVSDPSNAA